MGRIVGCRHGSYRRIAISTHPPECPVWDYSKIPSYDSTLREETEKTLSSLRDKSLDSLASTSDTRPIHHRFFVASTPKQFEYYAGNYRGQDFKCLKYCRVGVVGDPRVGTEPDLVFDQMASLSNEIKATIQVLDAAFLLPNSMVTPQQKLRCAVAGVCRIFEWFLRIHPYMDGNGHMARFCLVTMLARYGYWFPRFTIEPRPGPPYIDAIVQWRNGNPVPLEEYVLRCMAS